MQKTPEERKEYYTCNNDHWNSIDTVNYDNSDNDNDSDDDIDADNDSDINADTDIVNDVADNDSDNENDAENDRDINIDADTNVNIHVNNNSNSEYCNNVYNTQEKIKQEKKNTMMSLYVLSHYKYNTKHASLERNKARKEIKV